MKPENNSNPKPASGSFTERFTNFALGYLYMYDNCVLEEVKERGVKAVLDDKYNGMGGFARSDWQQLIAVYFETRGIDYYLAIRRRHAKTLPIVYS